MAEDREDQQAQLDDVQDAADEGAAEEAAVASPEWLDDHEGTVRQAIERLEELSAENARLEKAHARLKKENERLQEDAAKLRDKVAKAAKAAKAGKQATPGEDGSAEDWQAERAEIRNRVEALTETLESLLED